MHYAYRTAILYAVCRNSHTRRFSCLVVFFYKSKMRIEMVLVDCGFYEHEDLSQWLHCR